VRDRAGVARWAHNPKVVGSNPSPATNKKSSAKAEDFLIYMNFTVYVLYSEEYNKHYVGYSSNLEARFLSHNQLTTKGYTVKYRPWKIIHTEVFAHKTEALKREKYLKSGVGRAYIKSLPH
jgi:putative endonuclease